jgi:hypothetical protein
MSPATPATLEMIDHLLSYLTRKFAIEVREQLSFVQMLKGRRVRT